MARYGLVIDSTKCSGCHNCFLACRDEFYGNDYPGYSAAQPLNDQFWMQIREFEQGTYPRPKLTYVPIPCQHCQDAPCIAAAENGAVYRRDDGIVLIDPEKAKGQTDIVNGCPYRVIFWNECSQIPQKCTLCAHRLDQGEKQPRCVESCPTGALVFGDLADPTSAVAHLMADRRSETLHPEFGVRPQVAYIGLPKLFIMGEVVLQDNTGECAQGVPVLLQGQGVQLQTVTDTYGDFEFTGLAKNTEYRISVQKAGYRPFATTVVTKSTINLGEIVLSPQ